jgi:hypothetical protein
MRRRITDTEIRQVHLAAALLEAGDGEVSELLARAAARLLSKRRWQMAQM